MPDLSAKELYEYYKDLHYKEIERTDKLYSMIQLPVTLVSALSLVFLYYLNKLPGLVLQTSVLLFWLFFFVGSLCLFGAIVNIVWAVRPPGTPKLQHWPDADEMFFYLEGLRSRYSNIEERFYNAHVTMLRKTIKTNFSRNRGRDIYQHAAISWVLLALALYALAVFPHRTIHFENRPQLMKIVT